MITGILLAGGKGERFDSREPKQFVKLDGKTVLNYSLSQLERTQIIDKYVLVVNQNHRQKSIDTCSIPERNKCLSVVEGGRTRRLSVKEGLKELKETNPSAVFVHDSARPLTPDLIYERLLDKIDDTEFQGVVPVLPVRNTIKQVDETNQRIMQTLDRSRLRRTQTPQLFDYSVLYDVHFNWQSSRSVTDDAMMIEENGYTVGYVEGSEKSQKITVKSDLRILESFLEDTNDG